MAVVVLPQEKDLPSILGGWRSSRPGKISWKEADVAKRLKQCLCFPQRVG